MKYKASTYENRMVQAARKLAIAMDSGKIRCHYTNGALHPTLKNHLDTIMRNGKLRDEALAAEKEQSK